jgi:hypothetical protein
MLKDKFNNKILCKTETTYGALATECHHKFVQEKLTIVGGQIDKRELVCTECHAALTCAIEDYPPVGPTFCGPVLRIPKRPGRLTMKSWIKE